MKLALGVECALALLCVTCLGQVPDQSVILPSSEAQSVSRLCSRQGPEHLGGGWLPSTEDIAKLERQLGDVSRMAPMSISKPFSYRRQYVGIIIDGKRLIYVNAFPSEMNDAHWKTRFVSVCDGGPSFWGVIFDPSTGKFSELHGNGRA